MKYILTGGAGFIGSNLAQKLLLTNRHVCIIDNLSTGQFKNIKPLLANPRCTFIRADMNEPLTWKNNVEKDDVIVHLAATVGVKKVCINPFETIENNIKGIETVLNTALQYQCKVLYASSSEVYGQSANEALKEDDALRVYAHQGGRSAYVLSKLMGEHYCFNYHNQYELPVIICRLFNVAGIHQSPSYGMVVPTFVQQALTGKPITVFGDGNQKRSFCNAQDVANAICMLLDNNQAFGQAFNIGNTETITINKLAEFIKQATGSASRIVHEPLPFERSDGKDIYQRTPSIEKIHAVTGWTPETSWKKTVLEIIEFEKDHIAQLSLNGQHTHEKFIYS